MTKDGPGYTAWAVLLEFRGCCYELCLVQDSLKV